VPISIAVLPGDKLDSSTTQGVTEALNRVPGVAATLAVNGGGTQVAVRGVSASGPLFSGSSPVAYYLDWVPFGLVKTAIVPDANAFDLARVEILRGPQGTLYGANAQNGVVRVLTKDANLSDTEIKARALISSTDGGGENYRGDLAINIPVMESKLAARAVFGYQDLGGWIDRPTGDDVNDAKLRNARLKVNAQPTDKLSIGLSAWITREDYGAPSVANENDQHSSLTDESIDTDYDTYGLRIGYDSTGFSVASMTSYLDYQNQGSVGLEFFGTVPLFTRLDADVFSEEIILSSASGNTWRWSLGGFYRDAEDRLRQNSLDPSLAPFDYSNGSQSYAVFGEIGRRFADDKWEWTAGARYFRDEVSLDENINQGPPNSSPIKEEDSFDSTTPRLVLTWYPTSDLTLYTSYAEGFRSGFPQDPGVIRSSPDFPAVEPDKLHNYEIGAKAELMGGRVLVDSALYYVDWEDVQQTISVVFGSTIVTAPINGESASGLGVDFGITLMPVEGLQLALNGGWNDLAMDAPVVLPGGVVMFDKGDRLNLSPEYTAGASVDYSWPLGHFTAGVSAAANYTSAQIQRTAAGPFALSASGESMLIARTNFSLAAGNWIATLFADNINNENDAALRSPLLAFGAVDWSLRARPRTVGLQLEYRF
jgi:outer membrane receptor protein involved in Fe transport